MYTSKQMQHSSTSSEIAAECSREDNGAGNSGISGGLEGVEDAANSSVGLEVRTEDVSDTDLLARREETLRCTGDVHVSRLAEVCGACGSAENLHSLTALNFELLPFSCDPRTEEELLSVTALSDLRRGREFGVSVVRTFSRSSAVRTDFPILLGDKADVRGPPPLDVRLAGCDEPNASPLHDSFRLSSTRLSTTGERTRRVA